MSKHQSEGSESAIVEREALIKSRFGDWVDRKVV